MACSETGTNRWIMKQVQIDGSCILSKKNLALVVNQICRFQKCYFFKSSPGFLVELKAGLTSDCSGSVLPGLSLRSTYLWELNTKFLDLILSMRQQN